jgi:signal transduction histidine kinase/ActR/RegA family two-component response regulator
VGLGGGARPGPGTGGERAPARPSKGARKAAGALIALVVGLLAVYVVSELRHDTEQAELLVGSLVKALDYQVEGSLRNVDVLLDNVAERLNDGSPADPAFLAWCRVRAAGLPELHDLVIADAGGQSLRVGLAMDTARADDASAAIADREWFAYHRTHPNDRSMHVGDPVISRFDGRPALPLSRSLVGPRGEFKGVVTVLVDPTYFTDMLNKVELEEAGGASIIRRDGVVLARTPNQDATFGLSVAGGQLFLDHVAHNDAGIVRTVSMMDGHRKIIGFRTLTSYPVVATLGLTTWTALAQWRKDVLLMLIVVGVFSSALYRAAYLVDTREHTRAQLSADLERHNRILERQVDELRDAHTALAKAKAEAERANIAKSQFLAAASHDLRQPLQALTLYLWTLARRLPPGDGLLVSNMDRCLSGLNELLTDLLDLSKLDAGVLRPTVRDFLISELIERVVSAHHPAAEGKGISLRWVATRLTVRSDATLLERVISNLTSNAVRYTDRGGVLIGCRRRGGRGWIEVWDTGIGIPDSSLGEIFEEFKQLANPERSRDKGSGLGLAIVRRTLDLLGLEITVRSRPGKGSVFAVEVPLGDGAELGVGDTRHRRTRLLRIALVEDDTNVRRALADALRASGHQVVSAATGGQLRRALGSRAPQVVIADYRLAGLTTGVEAITSIRQAFGRDIHGIIMTGDTDPAVVRAITASGFPVLHKPASLEALQACIAELTAHDRTAQPGEAPAD